MSIETFKLPVRELVTGMHVVKLDRPWLETPFQLQGFRIKTADEIKLLQKHCSFVFVEIERGMASSRERITLSENGEVLVAENRLSAPAGSRAQRDYSPAAGSAALPPPAVQYAIQAGFAEELPAARAAASAAKIAVRELLEVLRQDTRADLSQVKQSASALEESVLRNPDPLMLLRALRSDEAFSFRHCVHSAILAIGLGRALGFKRQTLHELTMGVLLADIGKPLLPQELLRTTRRLDRRESDVVQTHVKYGLEIAAGLGGLTPGTLEVIASHHERFDGSGYPLGLCGSAIPLLARIAGLVDSIDAITSERAYSASIPMHEAVRELYASADEVFQRELVEQLIQVLGAFPVGSLVELSDGSVAVVVALNRQRRLLPQVIRLSDAHKLPVSDRSIVNLAAEERPGVTVKGVLEPGAHGIMSPTAEIVAA